MGLLLPNRVHICVNVRVWVDSVTDCICYANGSVCEHFFRTLCLVVAVYTSSCACIVHISPGSVTVLHTICSQTSLRVWVYLCVRVASCYIFKRCISTVQIKLRSISRLFGRSTKYLPATLFLPLPCFTIMVTFCMLIKCMQNYANFPAVLECSALKVFEFLLQLVFSQWNIFFLYEPC